MAVHVLDAANHLCKRSGWTLTQIELQKLLYIAHMIHLGTYPSPLSAEILRHGNLDQFTEFYTRQFALMDLGLLRVLVATGPNYQIVVREKFWMLHVKKLGYFLLLN